MKISENSRVWIYQADRILNQQEVELIQTQLDGFTSQWLAHGHELLAYSEIRYNQFIILYVDEVQAGATGCSIDKSVQLMLSLEKQFNINLFDRFRIAYRDAQEIRTCNRGEFESMIKEGQITGNTIVFNNLVSTKKALDSNWEVPVKDSWHAQVFGILTHV